MREKGQSLCRRGAPERGVDLNVPPEHALSPDMSRDQITRSALVRLRSTGHL